MSTKNLVVRLTRGSCYVGCWVMGRLRGGVVGMGGERRPAIRELASCHFIRINRTRCVLPAIPQKIGSSRQRWVELSETRPEWSSGERKGKNGGKSIKTHVAQNESLTLTAGQWCRKWGTRINMGGIIRAANSHLPKIATLVEQTERNLFRWYQI